MSNESKLVQFVKGSHYRSLPKDPIPWIVDGILPVGGMCNLYGPQKLGKSFAALQMAHAIANPTIHDWLGQKIFKHGTVAYFQVDTPRTLWMKRIDDFTEQLGYNFEDVWFSDSLLIPRHPFNILAQEDLVAMQEGLKACNPLAIVIDTLREVHEEDEDKATSMKRVMAAVYAATRPAAVLLVSHSRKDHPERGDDVIGDQRGSNYLAGRVDAVVKHTAKKMMIKSRSNINDKINCHQTKPWGEIVRDPDDQEIKILNRALKMKGSEQEKVAWLQKELSIDLGSAQVKLAGWITRKMEEVKSGSKEAKGNSESGS